jgi:hypothetical protein
MADKGKPEVRNGLWPSITFTYGEVTVTVERKTVRHSITISRVIALLPDTADIPEQIHQHQFARMIAQTTAVSGLEIALPGSGAGKEAIIAAYEAFLDMDGHLLDAWHTALEDVDRPPAAKEHWPSHRLAGETAKNPTSAG